MPDITMCENEKCLFKEECFRYTAKPSEHRKSYADFEPIVEDGKVSCDWFWDNKGMYNHKWSQIVQPK